MEMQNTQGENATPNLKLVYIVLAAFIAGQIIGYLAGISQVKVVPAKEPSYSTDSYNDYEYDSNWEKGQNGGTSTGLQLEL